MDVAGQSPNQTGNFTNINVNFENRNHLLHIMLTLYLVCKLQKKGEFFLVPQVPRSAVPQISATLTVALRNKNLTKMYICN